MKGRLYCIGLGPGDPELVTMKALRLMKECSVWFIPQSGPDKETAGQILQAAANYADEDLQVSKTIVKLAFPMTRSEEILEEAHRKNAEIIEAYLDKGEDAALFTLGCPTVYASCSYVERRVALAGYDTQIVPGVTSFCAAAAALGTSLCEKDEPLLVVPANRNDLADLLEVPGNTIIMKPSSANDKIRPLLEKKGLISMASMVQQCGTKEEKILFTLEGTVPHSYFSVILVKKEESI